MTRTGPRMPEPKPPTDPGAPTEAGAPTEPGAPTEAGPATVTEAAPGDGDHPRLTLSRAVLDAIIHGNSVMATVLAIVAAMVIGGLLIAFTDPVVLTAWGRLFSAPGSAIAAAWHSVTAAYSNMLEGGLLNPHPVSSAFPGCSVAAVFNPLSDTAVNATPLIFAGLSVALG